MICLASCAAGADDRPVLDGQDILHRISAWAQVPKSARGAGAHYGPVRRGDAPHGGARRARPRAGGIDARRIVALHADVRNPRP